jgi:hypothetical protein
VFIEEKSTFVGWLVLIDANKLFCVRFDRVIGAMNYIIMDIYVRVTSSIVVLTAMIFLNKDPFIFSK